MKYFMKGNTLTTVSDSGETTVFTSTSEESVTVQKGSWEIDETYSPVGTELGHAILLGLSATAHYMAAVAEDIESAGFDVRDCLETVWKELDREKAL